MELLLLSSMCGTSRLHSTEYCMIAFTTKVVVVIPSRGILIVLLLVYL